jgi:teichuronic acid biosynthesis glycosyltransferase TuaG
MKFERLAESGGETPVLPKVTIVIPFYNCAYVHHAIESALNQSYPHIEIIVVDDGSTKHVKKIRPYLSRIHYLGKANGGTASALNHGIRMATGEYIAWLSSDDIFYRDKINNQMNFMLRRNALLSFSSFDLIDRKNRVTQRAVGIGFSTVLDFYRFFFNGNPINGCTVIANKQLFAQVGMFDEALPYTHDLDLWYRAMIMGYEFHYLNQALIGYRWHSQMGTVKYRQAIDLEVAETNARFRPQMAQLIDRLSAVGVT